MSVTITAHYAVLATILFLILSFLVIATRTREGIGGRPPEASRLEQLIRAHGNFAEYVPLALVLMLLAEVQGAPAWLLQVAGACLILGRVLHALGLTRRPESVPMRVGGMVLTFNALGFAAVGVLLPMI